MIKNTESSPMRDLIDERNEWEKISKSVIKRWNVNYIPKQQEVWPEGDTHREPEAAEEIGSRKFNEATGSPSGDYGRQEIQDEVTKGQIDKILQEKSESLRHLIDENQH